MTGSESGVFNASNDALIHAAIQAGEVTVEPDVGFVTCRGRAATARPDGYLTVFISRPVLAHRVMWLYHYPQTPSTLQINHRNGRRWDNRLSNLEAVTPKGNGQHAHTIAYAAVTEINDDNAVDPDWFAQVMQLASDPDATPEQIRALKTTAPIDDSRHGIYSARLLTRPCYWKSA